MFKANVVQSCWGLWGLQVLNSAGTNEGKSHRKNLICCGPSERALGWHLPLSGMTQAEGRELKTIIDF